MGVGKQIVRQRIVKLLGKTFLSFQIWIGSGRCLGAWPVPGDLLASIWPPWVRHKCLVITDRLAPPGAAQSLMKERLFIPLPHSFVRMNIIKRIEPKVCELRERISIYSNLLVSCSRCKRTPELRHLMHPSQNLL